MTCRQKNTQTMSVQLSEFHKVNGSYNQLPGQEKDAPDISEAVQPLPGVTPAQGEHCPSCWQQRLVLPGFLNFFSEESRNVYVLHTFVGLTCIVLWAVCVAGWQSFAWVYRGLSPVPSLPVWVCFLFGAIGLGAAVKLLSVCLGNTRAFSAGLGQQRSCWKRVHARQPARAPA